MSNLILAVDEMVALIFAKQELDDVLTIVECGQMEKRSVFLVTTARNGRTDVGFDFTQVAALDGFVDRSDLALKKNRQRILTSRLSRTIWRRI